MRAAELSDGGEHHAGVVHQGPRDRAALLLAARELGGAMAHATCQAHLRQDLFGARTRRARRRAADQQRHHDVLQSRKLAQEMMKLEHKTELPVPQFRRPARVEIGIARAIQPDVSGRRTVERPEEMEQRAFPCPRGADDRDELPAPHLDVDAGQDLEHLPVAAREDTPDRPAHEERVHSYRIAVTGSSRAAWTLG